MRATAMSGSPRTTLVAGLASAGALLLQLPVPGGLRVQPTPEIESTIVLQGPVVTVLVLILAVGAAVVLARGVRGEPGLLRASRVAGVAALVGAGAQVAVALTGILVRMTISDPAGAGDRLPSDGVIVLSQGVYGVQVAAMLVLAVAVARGRLLEPLARFSLLVLGAATALYGVLMQTLGALGAGVETSPFLPLLFALPTLILVASAALVVGLLMHGRSAAMRARAEGIRRAW